MVSPERHHPASPGHHWPLEDALVDIVPIPVHMINLDADLVSH